MPPPQRSSHSQKLQKNATTQGLVWQLQENYISPGKMAWMSVALAGWQTAVFGTLSTSDTPTVVATWSGSARCISMSTRQVILILIPAMMPSAIEVSAAFSEVRVHCSLHNVGCAVYCRSCYSISQTNGKEQCTLQSPPLRVVHLSVIESGIVDCNQ